MGKNEQIVEVQVPSTDNGKSTHSLKPHVLDSPKNLLLLPETLWIGCKCTNSTREKPLRSNSLRILDIE